MGRILLEGAIDSVDSAGRAVREGADRLEVCGDLSVGGVTPERELLLECVALGVPCVAMARPRGGDFVYDAVDCARLMADVEMVLECGVAGVVFGVLRPDGTIDAGITRRVVHRCGTVPTVFHRAFDDVPDQRAALDVLMDCGVTRVLTSGGAPAAIDAADAIGALVNQAAGRIEILAGGGVRAANVLDLVARAGVDQVHARATEAGVIMDLRSRLDSEQLGTPSPHSADWR